MCILIVRLLYLRKQPGILIDILKDGEQRNEDAERNERKA